MTYSLILIVLIISQGEHSSLAMERIEGYSSEKVCTSVGREWVRGYNNNRDFSCVQEPVIEDKKESEDS